MTTDGPPLDPIDETLPPASEPKWKRYARAAVAYARLHWTWCGPLIGFAAGFIVSKL